jgi:tRNA(Ile)-lysidine synthase
VLRTVTATAREHRMFERGDLVLVAVSGGPDSVCLLHSLVRLHRLLRIRTACFHFDHRLRAGSEADARYVRRQADALGAPFFLRVARTRPGKGESVEAWARVERYRAAHEVLEEIGAAAVAVGHTADDQAETVLLALARGAGLDALTGMEPVSRPVVRPLLFVPREETAAFCRSLGLRPRQDPMNDDPRFARAAVRSHVLPVLERAAGRNVRPAIVRTADLLREDARLLDDLAEAREPSTVRREGSEVVLDAAGLSDLPRPLASRVVRRALLSAGLLPESPHVEAVLTLAAGRPGRRVSLPGGLVARRDRAAVVLG